MKTAVAVQAFQLAAGISTTGNVGFATWEALRHTRRKGHPSEYAFDQRACSLAAQAAGEFTVSPKQKVQHAGVDAANFWILHRDESSYGQVRPMHLAPPPHVEAVMDCSWFVTDVFFAGGAPDPNGRRYDGLGYTGTLVSNGQQINIADIDLLDLVFYGFTVSPSAAFPYGSPTHVTVYIGGGFVASDGSQSGPEKRTLDYRGAQLASAQHPFGIHSVRRYPLV